MNPYKLEAKELTTVSFSLFLIGGDMFLEILGEVGLAAADGLLRFADFCFSADGDAKDRRITAAERRLGAQKFRRDQIKRRHRKVQAKRSAS